MKIRYVRQDKNFIKNGEVHKQVVPVACLVGGLIDGEPFVSVACCSKKDRFHKRIGREIAMGRFNHMRKGHIPSKLKRVVEPEINKFVEYLKKEVAIV